jgi:hypothetical protein
MRLMAIQTPVSCRSGDGIMLKDEGTGGLRMAGDAHVAGLTQPCLCSGLLERFTTRVNLMAVAAQQPSFRNRMMEILTKLSDLALMALATHRQFVRF